MLKYQVPIYQVETASKNPAIHLQWLGLQCYNYCRIDTLAIAN